MSIHQAVGKSKKWDHRFTRAALAFLLLLAATVLAAQQSRSNMAPRPDPRASEQL